MDKQKFTLEVIKEFLELLWINLKVTCKNLIEFLKVVVRYYPNLSFAKIDTALLLTYLFRNPFTISKRSLMKKGEGDVYAYGETPLTTLEKIANECQITSHDRVFELGCGRGRTCFWLNVFKGCPVVGIEFVPEFVDYAQHIKEKMKIQNVTFRKEDMVKSDFKSGTVFYLYGTSLHDDVIHKLVDKFSRLPSGTKIITVSYTLKDYSSKPVFEIMKRFPAKFTWGEADIYLQIVK